MNIDFHNHFFPEAYIKELKKEKGYAEVKTDSQGRVLIYYSGDYNIVVGPHVDIKQRIEEMDKYNMDMQVLTLTTPGVERETAKRGIHLARVANDIFSDIVGKYPDRFVALATLPLQDTKASVDELRRAVKDLGLSGGMIFSNINNKTLDLKEFWPIYEEAVKLDVPLFIHPTTPIDLTGLIDYRLVPMLGFTLDTSLAVTRMIYGGVFDKYPSLKVVASHLGGTLPFLVG
jgi:aminocarboxymuconate-semialdehyde decarboxylase